MALEPASWTCSEFSASAGEPLIGSAPRVDVWLLLGYAGSWERNALKSSEIPQPVKDALSAAEQAIPNARIVLIKQETRRGQAEIAFFLARSSPSAPALFRFNLNAYEDLLEIDLQAVLNGDARYSAHRVDEPMFIVCTNGRRDACCARNGLPLARLMAQAAPGRVWECTHLGGHRLGPNVAALPDGLMYGRVKAVDAADVLDATRIPLGLLRGRSCFDPPAQAAEFFVRRELNARASGGLSLEAVTEIGQSQWSITMRLGEQRHVARVEQVAAGYATYASCGDDAPKEVLEFRLVDLSQEPA